jgi:uncharacterized membrane protein
MSDDLFERPSRSSGWKRLLLPASLILNLFFIALIGAHFLNMRSREPENLTLVSRFAARVQNRLPAEDAAIFASVMRRDSSLYAEAGQQFAAARQELLRQLAADPFDKAAARQALTAWQAAGSKLLDPLGDSFIDALSQISPASRRKLISERAAGKPE